MIDTPRSVTDRILCSVIGCRRTSKRLPEHTDDTRIICGKCWRLGRKSDRRLYRLCKRRLTRGDVRTNTLYRIKHRAWERVLKTATEARVGIG